MTLADEVIVLGAGLSGLAAAQTVARAGLPTTALERAGVLGGLARTVVYGDFRFDIGGHRWFTKKDEINAFVLDLLGPDLLDVRRASHIRYDGKYFEYPIRLRNILGRVKPSTMARILAECMLFKALSISQDGRKPDASMQDAFVAQFGPSLYKMFFKGYSRKVWGRDCAQMSGDWVDQRSRGLSLWAVAKASLFGNGGRAESLVERFKYPRLGIGQIGDSMGRLVESNGGRVLRNQQVRELVHSGGRVEAVRCESSGASREFAGSHFISSIPLTDLVESLRPAPPTEVCEAASRLVYRDVITVNVMLDGDRVTGDTWIYVHDPDVPFGRLHEPANWSPFMAPSGKTSLVAEYFCSVGDCIWATSDDVLSELTVNSLADKLHLIARGDVLGAFVVRSTRAYPTYLLGYGSAVKLIRGYLSRFENLQTIGRSGTFRYSNMDDCIEMGILAARSLLEEEPVSHETSPRMGITS